MTFARASLLHSVVLANAGGPLPDPETVRKTAREVLARPQYQLDTRPDLSGVFATWLRLLRQLNEAINDFFKWLHGMSPVLAWLLTAVLLISLALLLGHIGWTLFTALRKDLRRLEEDDPASRRKLDPVQLAREADEAGARGDYILGVRLLYRACLVRLEQFDERSFRPGATNREHLDRYRATPLYDWLARLVSIIDLKWYGSEPCRATDFAECRDAYQRICSLAQRSPHAQHA